MLPKYNTTISCALQVFFLHKNQYFQRVLVFPPIHSIIVTINSVKELFPCGLMKAYFIRSTRSVSAVRRASTTACSKTVSARWRTGRNISQSWAATRSIFPRSLNLTAMAMTRATSARSTAGSALTRILLPSAIPFTKTASRLYSTVCSTTLAAAFGHSATCRRKSGTPLIKTGSTSRLRATPTTTTASGTRAGRAITSWSSST